ncbi:MAG: VOC family protein [Actinomycetota bacterium]
MNLNSLLIGSENPQALADFYGKIFGKPGFEDGGYTGWQVGGGFITVGPHDSVKGPNPSPERILLNFETSDVKGEFERIKGLGATVVKEPYDPGEGIEEYDSGEKFLIATFSDPDNNYFQLMSPMPPEMAEKM